MVGRDIQSISLVVSVAGLLMEMWFPSFPLEMTEELCFYKIWCECSFSKDKFQLLCRAEEPAQVIVKCLCYAEQVLYIRLSFSFSFVLF